MSTHPFDNDFLITREHKETFRRDGFIKLEGFLNAAVVNTLRERVEVEMDRGVPNTLKADSQFYRAKYDFETERSEVYDLLERPYFGRALTDVAERDLFLTNEVCFEVEKNVSKGFPWHVGTQSFGFSSRTNSRAPCGRPCMPSIRRGSAAGWLTSPGTSYRPSTSSTNSSRRLSQRCRPRREPGSGRA